MTRYDTLPAGQRIADRYIVEAPLGRGRSSTVYKAHDLHTDTTVALKVLDPFLAHDPVSVERFAREVRLLRAVQHPNVIKVYDLLEDDGLFVICMEYFASVDGKAYVQRRGRMPLPEFLAVAQSVVAAVDACHAQGVLHRDLKPHNILISDRGDVKVVDFGVSKVNSMSDLTKTGSIIGTPEYMAPELFHVSLADPRSDIYALGAVFYELLTGRPPHPGGSLSALMRRHAHGEVEAISTFRADVPAYLEAVVVKCLRIDPSQRYQSCYALRSDLQRGEQAVAFAEQRLPASTCLACKSVLIVGLPFCHACGKFTQEIFARGDHSVILYRCDDVDGLARHLQRSFRAGAHDGTLREQLTRLPVLLFAGVSAPTAASVASELASLPCELRVSDKLPAELRLPFHYALVALLPLLILWWGSDSLGLVTRAAVVLGCLLIVLLLYREKVRPLISLAPLRRAGDSTPDPGLVQLVERCRALSDPHLKTTLGHIVNGMLHVRKRLLASRTILDAAEVTRAVERGFEAAGVLERCTLYLSSRSLNQIKERMNAVEARLRVLRDPALETLIRTKARLDADFRTHQELEDLHARLLLALLNLGALLKRVDDTLAMGGELTAARNALQEVTAELTAAAAQPFGREPVLESDPQSPPAAATG